jgi:dTDP-4-amino-4,6-dideoxygalactose transaminase
MNVPFFGLDRQYVNLKDELLEATNNVLSSGQLMSGKYTEEFEDWLARKNKSRHAVVCHSGTNALEIIAKYWYMNFMIQSHAPIVYIPTLTFPATANAFISAGWDVKLIDCNRHGQSSREHKLHHKAFHVYVGLYGTPITAPSITSDIIIEDGAQHWLSNDCYRIGHATAISFDPTKNLPSSGNGGAIVTNDDAFADWIREYQNHGKPKHQAIGTNTRMSELECAHLLVRTKYLDAWQQRRQEIVKMYNNAFNDLEEIQSLIKDAEIKTHACHKYVIVTDDRDNLKNELQKDGIETRIHYEEPLHEISCFRNRGELDMLSTASVLSRKVLSLPLYPELTDDDVAYVIECVLHHTSH